MTGDWSTEELATGDYMVRITDTITDQACVVLMSEAPDVVRRLFAGTPVEAEAERLAVMLGQSWLDDVDEYQGLLTYLGLTVWNI